MEQVILTAENGYTELDRYIRSVGADSLFLVCGASIRSMPVGAYFDTLPDRLQIRVTRFSDFCPNPSCESAAEGIRAFRASGSKMIAAVGGGSAIDVAKCIRIWNETEVLDSFWKQAAAPNNIPFLAVPTTAGSGSEATRFAVLYHQGEKLSITHPDCRPSAVLLDSSTLRSLPLYHKKAAMLDALCHGIESCWSVNSTAESREYSREGIRLLMANYRRYLRYGEGKEMLWASHLAGRAIHITQTTAGHAMCYQLTSRYKIAHGHAAALCVEALWPHMLEHMGDCVDLRGQNHLEGILQEIAQAMGCTEAGEAPRRFHDLLAEIGMEMPDIAEEELDVLTSSVAPERLKNHPVRLDREAIYELYRQIFHVV